jgi:hypothetical protein
MILFYGRVLPEAKNGNGWNVQGSNETAAFLYLRTYVMERLYDFFFHVNELAIVGLEREINFDSPYLVGRHFPFPALFGFGESCWWSWMLCLEWNGKQGIFPPFRLSLTTVVSLILLNGLLGPSLVKLYLCCKILLCW